VRPSGPKHPDEPPPEEGAAIELRVIEEGDDLDLDDEERAELHESIRQSIADAEAGMLVDADELLRELRSRS
jgi:hypothetical protein